MTFDGVQEQRAQLPVAESVVQDPYAPNQKTLWKAKAAKLGYQLWMCREDGDRLFRSPTTLYENGSCSFEIHLCTKCREMNQRVYDLVRNVTRR